MIEIPFWSILVLYLCVGIVFAYIVLRYVSTHPEEIPEDMVWDFARLDDPNLFWILFAALAICWIYVAAQIIYEEIRKKIKGV